MVKNSLVERLLCSKGDADADADADRVAVPDFILEKHSIQYIKPGAVL